GLDRVRPGELLDPPLLASGVLPQPHRAERERRRQGPGEGGPPPKGYMGPPREEDGRRWSGGVLVGLLRSHRLSPFLPLPQPRPEALPGGFGPGVHGSHLLRRRRKLLELGQIEKQLGAVAALRQVLLDAVIGFGRQLARP